MEQTTHFDNVLDMNGSGLLPVFSSIPPPPTAMQSLLLGQATITG